MKPNTAPQPAVSSAPVVGASSVESALDSYLLRTEKPRPPDGFFHPSSIFGCERQAVYEVRGVPQTDERDARSRRILRIGTHLGEVLQRAMEDDPTVLATYSEVAISLPELGVSGHCDALRQLTADEWELVEDKTIGSKGFRYAPKAEHISQARTYAMAIRRNGGIVTVETSSDIPDRDLGRYTANDGPGWSMVIPPLGDDLKRIRLVYWSKDDLKIAEFTFDVDPQWESEFEQKMTRLAEYRKLGATALPVRLPLDLDGERNWLCGYCAYRTRCWTQDTEGEQND